MPERRAADGLPVVLLPVGVDDDALDACLGALDAGTPAGSRVWLADDAQAGPRGQRDHRALAEAHAAAGRLHPSPADDRRSRAPG